MLIVQVHIHVKPEYIESFKEASIDNAQNSLKEPGVVRFDFLQQQDDPARFMLVEIYRSVSDTILHKETAHYMRWRDRVAEMMAEPRSSVKYSALFPDESQWS